MKHLKDETEEKYEAFFQVCRMVEDVFEADWRDTDETARSRKLEREKRAIIGYEKERTFYQERIHDIVTDRGWQNTEHPPWYQNLAEGIFHQVYGLAGLAPWVYDTTEAYRRSSSAKLIGDRLYCLIDGKSVLQPQRIDGKRREQLKRALLLSSPRERLEEGFHEVYLHNGIRITIFAGERTKPDQDIMVFRKYVLQNLSFESLAQLGTIPEDALPLFRILVKIGLNILITGPVRSGKTTFLQIWQQEEDPSLEGLAVATDPETPWHKIMPEAPLMQLVTDGNDLDRLTRSLMRGDNDYILLEEMRDAAAYHLALEITSTGTMRSKATIHDGSSVNIPYKMATAVQERYGGNLQSIIAQVFRNFHLVFRFSQEYPDRSRKRLQSISAYQYNLEKDEVSVHQLCEYRPDCETWCWKADFAWAEGISGLDRTGKEWKRMEELIRQLEYRNPLAGNTVIYPRYYRPAAREGGPE